MEADEKELEKLRKDETKHMKVIDELMKKLESHKTTKITKKSEVDDKESEANEVNICKTKPVFILGNHNQVCEAVSFLKQILLSK